MRNYFIFLVLGSILVLAFLLRSKMFLYGDFYMLPDQGRDMLLVKDIVVNHKLVLIGGHAGLGGIFHGPLWLYILLPFFLLSHGDPFWTLIPVYELVSLGLVISAFFIGTSLYGRRVGYVVALLLAISQTFVTTIMFTSNSQVMPLVFLWYLYFLIRYLRRDSKALLIALPLIGIGIHVEAAFAVLLFPVTLLAIYSRRIIPSPKEIGIGLGLFLLTIINYILFDLRHGFLMSHAILNLLTGHVHADKSNNAYANILFRIPDRIWWLVQSFKASLFQESPFLLMFLLGVIIAAGLLLIKNYNASKKESAIDKEMIFLAIIILLCFGLYIFFPLPLQAHYVQSLSIASILLVSLAYRKISLTRIGYGFSMLFLVVNLYPAVISLTNQYIIHPEYQALSQGNYVNQLTAVDYVFADARGKPFEYFVYDLPIVTYTMDYLFWWRGKTAYHYTPTSEKKYPLLYLVLLPHDPGNLHAHDFWIQHTVRTQSKPLSYKKLAGDITVEQHMIDPIKEPHADPNYYINLTFR